MDLLTEKLHVKLISRAMPKLTKKEIKDVTGIKCSDILTLERELMQRVSSYMEVDEKQTYLPVGTILSTSFMEWCGGLFDGDGCVYYEARHGKPALSLMQNSSFVKLFAKSFGGLCPSNRYFAYGNRAYFAAKFLIPFTAKKNPELQAVIDFYNGKLTALEYKTTVRKLKDEYPEQLFDVSTWNFPYIAGLIDSDGSISVADFGGRQKPFLQLRFHQKKLQHLP